VVVRRSCALSAKRAGILRQHCWVAATGVLRAVTWSWPTTVASCRTLGDRADLLAQGVAPHERGALDFYLPGCPPSGARNSAAFLEPLLRGGRRLMEGREMIRFGCPMEPDPHAPGRCKAHRSGIDPADPRSKAHAKSPSTWARTVPGGRPLPRDRIRGFREVLARGARSRRWRAITAPHLRASVPVSHLSLQRKPGDRIPVRDDRLRAVVKLRRLLETCAQIIQSPARCSFISAATDFLLGWDSGTPPSATSSGRIAADPGTWLAGGFGYASFGQE